MHAVVADRGRHARALREQIPGLTVHSQWDGQTARVVREWREDERSVLVGTKSMMTGVDAPGRTCQLMIIDRVPRSPSNPVDDARVEDLTARTGDKWQADRAVYATDAALLLSQAAGRLIRSTECTGMVACTDPRLLKRSPISYAESTRALYMRQLDHFGHRFTTTADAAAWLQALDGSSALSA